MDNSEFYISVDVETAGPNPGKYALLSIGACTVFEPAGSFYIELKPDKQDFLPEALRISGLKMETFRERGEEPKTAMQKFADWVKEMTPAGARPVFTAFNAPFDWVFVNEYFHRCLGYNPFGHTALDIKAYYMGLKGCRWGDTGMGAVTREYFGERDLTHHALRDAIDQAELFRRMLEEARQR